MNGAITQVAIAMIRRTSASASTSSRPRRLSVTLSGRVPRTSLPGGLSRSTVKHKAITTSVISAMPRNVGVQPARCRKKPKGTVASRPPAMLATAMTVADQEAAEREACRTLRERQDQGAEQRHDRDARDREPGAEAIEGQAHRHLHHGGGERHGAHDQADVGSAQAEHAVRLGCD